MVEPDLISGADFWVGDEVVGDVAPGALVGEEAVDEDERGFLGIVGLSEKEAGFEVGVVGTKEADEAKSTHATGIAKSIAEGGSEVGGERLA